jgi:hypothetical protein
LWLCIFDIVEIKTYAVQFPGAPNSNPSFITDYNTWEVPDLVFDGNFQFDSNSIQTLKTAVHRDVTNLQNDWGILTYVSPTDLNVSEFLQKHFKYSLMSSSCICIRSNIRLARGPQEEDNLSKACSQAGAIPIATTMALCNC